MKTDHRFLLCAAVVMLLAAARPACAQFTNYQFTTVDVPLGVNGTVVNGISGNYLVGVYGDVNEVQQGFLYNGTGFFTLSDPDGTNTEPLGVTGNYIVGGYTSSTGAAGFIFNGATFTKVLVPNSTCKVAAMGDGLVVGAYFITSRHGFLYDGTNFTSIDVPAATSTVATGISSGRVVGSYLDSNGHSHGYVYDGTTYSPLDDPLASSTHGGTQAIGISGNNITGIYYDAGAKAHGFIYNGTTYTTFDDPLGVGGTQLGAIDGLNVVGFYVDAQGKQRGFLATPQPELFNVWQTNHGISTSVASSTILYGDGVPLLSKYLAGIDPSRPMTAADRAALPHIIAANVQGVRFLSLRFRRSGTASQVQTQVQTSADMVTWTNDLADTPDNVFNDPATGDPTMQVQVPITSSVKFVRLEVTGP